MLGQGTNLSARLCELTLTYNVVLGDVCRWCLFLVGKQEYAQQRKFYALPTCVPNAMFPATYFRTTLPATLAAPVVCIYPKHIRDIRDKYIGIYLNRDNKLSLFFQNRAYRKMPNFRG